MNWITVVSSIFTFVGVAMLIVAGKQFTRRRAFVRTSVIATGTVIALVEDRQRDEISYFPQVKFQTLSGRDIVFQSGMGSSSDPTKIGAPVAVRYSVDQPDTAEIDAFMPLWGSTLLFGLLGMVFSFAGIGILTGLLAV